MSVVDRQGREVLGGGGVIPVEVHALGDELRRLWSETSEGDDPASPVMRACTRNLVVLCPDEASAERAAERIAGVADRYPSRAFLVRRVEGDPERLEATLQAQCMRLSGGRHVCSEQLGLRVGAHAGRRAASAIVPLLVPDLPVVVWTLEPPRWNDDLLERLLDVADRLLVDSRGSADPAEAARLFGDLVHGCEDDWSPGDFEWARLAPWREAVAMLFEDPELQGVDPVVGRVVVRHEGACRAGAALLAGWILDRLEAAGGPVPAHDAIALERVDPSGSTEAANAVAGTCIERGGGTSLEVARTDGGTLRLSITTAEACTLRVGLPCGPGAEENLLEELLTLPTAEPLYERALVHAAALLARDGA